MRIVQVNKFMYRRDGAAAYVLDLSRLLEEAGHQVAFFGMKQPQTIVTPWSDYFVNEIHFDRSEGFFKDIKKIGHMIWSTEARQKFSRLLDDFKPDVVHLHVTYHQISPSILPECRRRNIPVVLTAHDYHLISPNYSLITRGKPCERCLGGFFWRTMAQNCLDSWPKTVAGGFEHLIHRLLGIYERDVDRVICPSRFMMQMLARFGWDTKKLEHLPNPVKTSSVPASENNVGSGVLYAGRLSPEKGVAVLLEAARRLPDIPFTIAGDGPARRALEDTAPPNVRFLGFRPFAEIQELIAQSRLVSVPSIWYENFPYAALEPMALGKTVIASRIGGLPEIIRDQETGLLVPPADIPRLVDAIRAAYYDEALTSRLGRSAAAEIRRAYSPTDHRATIIKIYEAVIAAHR